MLARLGIIISTVLTLTYAAVLKVLSQLDTLLRLFVGNCVDVHLVQEGCVCDIRGESTEMSVIGTSLTHNNTS